MYVIINSDYCIIVVNLAELMCHLRHFFGQSIKILDTDLPKIIDYLPLFSCFKGLRVYRHNIFYC